MMLDGKGRLLVLLIITQVILIVLEFLFTPFLPPQMIRIDWEDEERIDTPLVPVYIRVLSIDDVTYLFYTANDPDPGNRSLFHMMNDGGGWSEPTKIQLSVPPYRSFDCAFDATIDEIHIFYCARTEQGLRTYTTKGRLEELGTVEPLTVGRHWGQYYTTGPIKYSAFFAKNGTQYLAYCYLSGATENANTVLLQTCEAGEWNGPVRVGTGNSPSALQASDGEVIIYSNLWTLVPGPQHVVDEWHVEDGKWKMTELTVTAEDSNVDPFVIEDRKGTRFLLYDHRKHTPEYDNDRVVIHSKREGEGWSNFDVIWKGGDEWSLDDVCATIEGSTIMVYWVSEGQLYSMKGTIQC